MIAQTPQPPYFAVIFTSIRNEEDKGYSEMASKMAVLAVKQEGFLGIESARQDLGITVSYWKDMHSINQWKENLEHQIAKNMGKSEWYKSYRVRISKVEKEY